MRNYIIFFTMLLLVACGKPDERCKSREEMRLTCQAEELAGLDRPTDWEINFAREQCNRQYIMDKCY